MSKFHYWESKSRKPFLQQVKSPRQTTSPEQQEIMVSIASFPCDSNLESDKFSFAIQMFIFINCTRCIVYNQVPLLETWDENYHYSPQSYPFWIKLLSFRTKARFRTNYLIYHITDHFSNLEKVQVGPNLDPNQCEWVEGGLDDGDI